MASMKKVGKWRAEGPVEDKGASKKKKMQEEGDEDMTRWHGWCAASAFSFNLLYYFHRCNNQQVECVWAVGAWGKT